jgi:hypothetical protein
MVKVLFKRKAPPTDGHGRKFVCEAKSPDGKWTIRVYGATVHCKGLTGYALCDDGWWTSFSFGYPVQSSLVSFRWDLPNDSWGAYVDGQCWAVYTYRAQLRMHKRRVKSRVKYVQGVVPFTDEDIRFICATKRSQKKGTRGILVRD